MAHFEVSRKISNSSKKAINLTYQGKTGLKYKITITGFSLLVNYLKNEKADIKMAPSKFAKIILAYESFNLTNLEAIELTKSNVLKRPKPITNIEIKISETESKMIRLESEGDKITIIISPSYAMDLIKIKKGLG